MDTYNREDRHRYFGREKETAQLYNAVFANNLTLLYGASGVGKSSLINCGLANKFYDTDWLPLFIRRNENINDTTDRIISDALSELAPLQKWGNMPVEILLEALYNKCFKPIYLIFDQLEELYTQGTREEQSAFYKRLKTVLTSGLQVKIILSIREEWIASLNRLERVIPTLFENRLRVERMNDYNIGKVIAGTIRTAEKVTEEAGERCVESVEIKLLEPVKTVMLIMENLRDERDGIDLTNLQVYIDRLYRRDLARQNKQDWSDTATFDPDLVTKVGEMKAVLSDFIDETIDEIEYGLKQQGMKNYRGIPLEILFTLVTSDGTKQAKAADTILQALPPNRQITEEQLSFCIEQLSTYKLLRVVE
ncbi:MAG: hypothetical protein RI894_1496 [Bacteroidota bacterium]